MIDKVVSKRRKPCGECPFRRNNILEGDEPGGSDVRVYIGQAQGPFWLPCHMDKNYDGKDSDPSCVEQCAGAAIFRANLDENKKLRYKLPEQLMFLESDTDMVFESFEEFYAHYKNVSLSQAKEILTPEVLEELLVIEMYKVG